MIDFKLITRRAGRAGRLKPVGKVSRRGCLIHVAMDNRRRRVTIVGWRLPPTGCLKYVVISAHFNLAFDLFAAPFNFDVDLSAKNTAFWRLLALSSVRSKHVYSNHWRG